MIVPALLSAIHMLTLAIGFAAIFARGRAPLVFVLEMTPMITFVRVRVARRRAAPLPLFSVVTYRRINDAEVALVVIIVFAAAFMARGAWLF